VELWCHESEAHGLGLTRGARSRKVRVMPRQPKEKMPPVPSGMKFDEVMRRVMMVKPESKEEEKRTSGEKRKKSAKRP
jgi:hypothetical protein